MNRGTTDTGSAFQHDISDGAHLGEVGVTRFGIVLPNVVPDAVVSPINNYTYTTPGVGIYMSVGGIVINYAGGAIGGADFGVEMVGIGTVTNAGSIAGLTSERGTGVEMDAGGVVANYVGGAISGAYIGVEMVGIGTVTNAGSIAGLTSERGTGVEMDAGGVVTNYASGAISGTYIGVAMGGSGTVTNAGSIAGLTGERGTGVALDAGGYVYNQAGGQISGPGAGTYITGVAGKVTNAGTITSSGIYATAAQFGAGGTLINQGGGMIAGSGAYSHGVTVYGGAGTVTNSGIITAAGNDAGGVTLHDGGSLLNTAGAKISGPNGGVYILGDTGTITNAGIIKSTGLGGAIWLEAGGTVTNQVGGTISGGSQKTVVPAGVDPEYFGGYGVGGVGVSVTNAGTIFGFATGVDIGDHDSLNNKHGATISGDDGVAALMASGDVINAGTISGSYKVALGAIGANAMQAGALLGAGVELLGGGSVTNSGSISGSTCGVHLADACALTDQAGSVMGGKVGVVLDTPAPLSGGVNITNKAGATIQGESGVLALGSAATVTNAGKISGTLLDTLTRPGGSYALGDGVALGAGGTVINQYKAGIYGVRFGVWAQSGAGTVTNSGKISSSLGFGVALDGGGTLNDHQTGNISGSLFGVFSNGGAVTVTNDGYISGLPDRYAPEISINIPRIRELAVAVKVNPSVGMFLGAGGTVTNNVDATITGGLDGVYVYAANPTITNSGSITATTKISLKLFDLLTVSLGLLSSAVFLDEGGTINNSGTLEGDAHGVSADNKSAKLVNSGTIRGDGIFGQAVAFAAGGSVNNSGTVHGGNAGVYLTNGVNKVTNSGTISAAPLGSAVHLNSGGILVNQSGGVVGTSAGLFGVLIQGGAGFVTNSGTIKGVTSISFGGTGANILTLETGSQLVGDAVGSSAAGATNALVLQGTDVARNNFNAFNSLDVQAGASWTLAGNSTIDAATIAGGLKIIGSGQTTARLGITGVVTVDSGGTSSLALLSVANGVLTCGDLQVGSAMGACRVVSGTGGEIDIAHQLAIASGSVLSPETGSLVIGTGVAAQADTVSVGNGGSLTGAGKLIGSLYEATHGSVEAQGGVLSIGGDISGGGKLLIADGATLDIGASDVNAVVYEGAGGTLKLEHPASLSGGLSGMRVGDIIDLAGVKVSDATRSGHSLTVTEKGGGLLTFQVAGTLAGTQFAVQSDGHGGSDIVVEPVSADSTTFAAAIETVFPVSGQTGDLAVAVVSEFDARHDAFSLATHVAGMDTAIKHGALSDGALDGDLAFVVDARHLGAFHAVIVEPDAGNFAGSIFLVIDENGQAGYQPGSDLVMELSRPLHIGAFSTANFVQQEP